MTRVLWLVDGYPWPGDPVGGIFFQTQARALAGLGALITVAAPTPMAPWPLPRLRDRWRRYAEAPRVETDDGVRVLRPRYLNVPGQPGWARPDGAIADAVWRSRRGFAGTGIVHGHYAITGLAAWRVARRTRLPFFLTFHGDDMNTWPDSHPGRVSDLRAAAEAATAVFAVSGALADRIRSVTGVAAVTLPIGSDHGRIARASLPREEARRMLGLPADALIVLFVGYLVREKGVRELVDAILELGEPYLGVFVGDGTERGYGIADRRAPGRLRYEGPKGHGDVVRFMSAADVLVLPSYGEGLPTVLVEAGSVGLPVIASPVGGIPELLGDGRGALLDEVSPAAIVSALVAFRSAPDAASRAAARLRDHVHADYDVHTNARTLLAHYRSADHSGDAA